MIARTPSSIAARKGHSSTSCSSSRLTATTGRLWWESSEVSPWPGKCLAQAATPADCNPLIQAAVRRATRPGSAPKERSPITGLSGLELTSAARREVDRHTGGGQVVSGRPSATSSVRCTSSTTPRA